MNTKKEESQFLDILKILGIIVFALTLCLLSWITIFYVGKGIANFATPYVNSIKDIIYKPEKNNIVQNNITTNNLPTNYIETLSCKITCLDGTTESHSAHLYSKKKECHIPALNPIVIKLDNYRNKVAYISTSDKIIKTRKFRDKISFSVDGIYYEILALTGSFASGRIKNVNNEERWFQHNKGMCKPIK